MPTNSRDDAVAVGNEDDLGADLLWGVPAIGKFINRKPRQVYYLIAKGLIPVQKRGHKIIVGSRSEIRKAFSSHE